MIELWCKRTFKYLACNSNDLSYIKLQRFDARVTLGFQAKHMAHKEFSEVKVTL